MNCRRPRPIRLAVFLRDVLEFRVVQQHVGEKCETSSAHAGPAILLIGLVENQKGLSVATQALDFGEPVGIRTRDLLIKSQLLYRLSYRPTAALTKESGRWRQALIRRSFQRLANLAIGEGVGMMSRGGSNL